MRSLLYSLAFLAAGCAEDEESFATAALPTEVLVLVTNESGQTVCGCDLVPTYRCGGSARECDRFDMAAAEVWWADNGGTIELGTFYPGRYDFRARLPRAAPNAPGYAHIELDVELDQDLDGLHVFTLREFESTWDGSSCWGSSAPRFIAGPSIAH